MIAALLWLLFALAPIDALPNVNSLEGDPEFRLIRLHWKYKNSVPELFGFKINYCELQAWGKYRCKTKILRDLGGSEVGPGRDGGQREFAATITGLRMATNYSIRVTPLSNGLEASGRSFPMDNEIKITTKGFSARAIQCLETSSVIEIDTGPHFGGKISVEGSEEEDCAVQGDEASPRATYLLTINHSQCGSQVQNTSVVTFVIVQENLPILTHSTRRFLVVCNYVPETFTVRAGVSLPDEESRQEELVPVENTVYEVDPSELFDSTNFFDPKISQRMGKALRISAEEKDKGPKMWAHLVLMIILVVGAVVGLSYAVWHFVRHPGSANRQGFLDTQEEPQATEHEENLDGTTADFEEGGMSASTGRGNSPVALVSVKMKCSSSPKGWGDHTSF